ncbi:MAG: ferric reductase-like transmembrane domain-containing protein [Planktomarina sp.]|uniref:ferredoxin reductase family protein n=1 Tax=Planktomarina sp. TaxID=2024851 RepID=UPI003260D1EA|nr:ferric reductase-like transmembrane domain-containing protein [Planktomarina sp.]
MTNKTFALATIFVFAHIAFVAPFVPSKNILPAGFGALSMTSMALVLVVAARWRLVDRILGGPDKSYGVHRWLGLSAIGGGLAHWALASPVGSGILPALAGGGRDAGLIAMLGLIVLTFAAMSRAIPYHIWKASHMLMGPLFLLAAFHTFFVPSPLALGAAPWTLMAAASIVGVIAWCQTLLRKLVPAPLVEVERATAFEGGVDVTFRSKKPLPKFQPGQFAMLAHRGARAEAHPFTIASGDAMTRRFVIRAAGDWTDNFVKSVKVGDRFRLGRGMGRFLPQTDSHRKEQFWVAGGVGITPFLAALERMQPDVSARVTLIFGIRSREAAGALDDVERHARRLPQLNLIVLSDDRNEGLTPPRLAQIIRDMSEDTQVYLCGPQGLKNMIVRAWAMAGMRGRIYSELFDFRGAYGMEHLNYILGPILDAARHVKLAVKRPPLRASA